MDKMCEELDGMSESQVHTLATLFIRTEMDVQVLALFKKTMRKVSIHLDEVCKEAVRERMDKEKDERGIEKNGKNNDMKALSKSLAVS